MSIWLFIGVVFAAVLLLAFWRGRCRTASTLDQHDVDPTEYGRRADSLAADSARAANARIAPNPGGFSF